MDFYDLLIYIGIPKRVRHDLRRLAGKLSDPTKYIGGSSYWYGGNGNGKTTFACHILAESLRRQIYNAETFLQRLDPKSEQYDRYYVPKFDHAFCWFPRLLQDIKDTFDSHYTGPSRSEIVDKFLNARMLVLDDVGVEMSTDWTYQTLYLIIGERYNEMLPTIITSNIPLDELGSKFQDTRVVSRIEEMCEGMIYHVDAKDYRVKG